VQHLLAQAIRSRFGGDALPPIINGTIGKKRRTEIVDGFQRGDEGFAPAILSTRVGGVGLHMTAANHVIHVGRWWNPALEDQCNDRVYRMGQVAYCGRK
jgi:SNF2 family DNA or RNA helicase